MAFLKPAILLLISVVVFDSVSAKIYDRCALVRDLRDKFKLPADQVPTWTCIAHKESEYNTAIQGKPNRDGTSDHGIFQINDKYWCSPPGTGKGCGVSCAEVKTDDITKSVACIRKIHAEWQRIHKNGFKAWSTYKFCDTPAKVNPYVANC